MPRKFYTIDDLYIFCKENNYTSFNAAERGAPLVVQSLGVFEATNNLSDGLMAVTLKSCHTGKNRNGSGISDNTMELYKDSFKGRPILGAIYKTDTGEYEFRSHDMEFVETDDGVEINYIEQPVGVISQTATPYLEFDEKNQKNYLIVEGTIFADYSKAAEILERRKTCKCSVEIAVEEMSYNCAEDYLSIDKFHFIGVTILGYEQDGVTEIQEGMAGSKITIDDFSEKRNSYFSVNYQDKLIEVLDKLNNTLSNFNIYHSEEEGGDEEMDNVENIVVEEAVEEVTEEVIVEEAETTEETHSEEETIVEETSTSEEDDDNQDEPVEEEKFTKNFAVELSHSDIQYALYNLIGQYDEEDGDWYYIRDVYDHYFYMQGWCTNKIYRLNYSVDGENVALVGDRQEMFELIVSESEKMAIEKMREDYAALESKYNELKSFKDQYDAAQVKAEKDAIFASAEYDEIRESDEFKQLVSDAENYTVDELKVKTDLLFAASMKKKFNFETQPEKKQRTVGVNFNEKPNKKKQAYGGLFAND